MWFEKIIIKRKLASPNAAIRLQAVDALNINSDQALLLQLAAADADSQVRAAAIRRCGEPERLITLRSQERDPHLQMLLSERLDQIYAELALQACAEERDCDAFSRIENIDTLINVALRSNSPALVLAAAARLAPTPEPWLKLVTQLTDDRLALELYQRNMPAPDSAMAVQLFNSARSRALREAVAAGRRRQQAALEAYQNELALVENIERIAESANDRDFEQLCNIYRALPQHTEELKKRFMASRYRFFRAREQRLANQEAEKRQYQAARDLFIQLQNLQNSGNWKLIKQVIEAWQRSGLDNAPGAAEFRNDFNALAAGLAGQIAVIEQKYSAALARAGSVLQTYQTMLAETPVPALEKRQELLQSLEETVNDLPEASLEIAAIREKVLGCERELRRRARLEAQERDLARWENYTLKCDICSELEKLAAEPDEALFEVAKSFRTLREKWNSIGNVPNEKFDELRSRYHHICTALHERLEKFFAIREEARRKSLQTKQSLLAEAEALSTSDDWSATFARLKELQELWKSAGSAGGAADRELFEKFHAACDAFFVRRNAVWEERKRSFMEASRRKKELCDAAEALRNKPFHQAKNEVAELRERWRSLPSAGKDDRLLYMQFNRAIENIFAAHREAGDEARRQAEIICTSLAELLKQARSGDISAKDIERGVLENQQRWENLSFGGASDIVQRRDSIFEELQNLLCGMHHQEAMHKLESAEQLEAVIDPGEDNEKLLDQLGRRLKVCGELENRLRECSIISGGGDLAGELQQAITGNFGGEDYQLTIAELDEFLQRFVAVGQVPPDARQAVFDRFRTLYNRALTELKAREKNPVESAE